MAFINLNQFLVPAVSLGYWNSSCMHGVYAHVRFSRTCILVVLQGPNSTDTYWTGILLHYCCTKSTNWPKLWLRQDAIHLHTWSIQLTVCEAGAKKYNFPSCVICPVSWPDKWGGQHCWKLLLGCLGIPDTLSGWYLSQRLVVKKISSHTEMLEKWWSV